LPLYFKTSFYQSISSFYLTTKSSRSSELFSTGKALDIVVGNGTILPAAMAIVYGMLFLASHFGEDDDLEMLLALSVTLFTKNIQGNVIERQC
jgi:hypothetical protein